MLVTIVILYSAFKTALIKITELTFFFSDIVSNCFFFFNHKNQNVLYYFTKQKEEVTDWRKNVDAMSGMEGRKKLFDAGQ